MFFTYIIRNRQLLFVVTELKDYEYILLPSLHLHLKELVHCSLVHCQRQGYVLVLRTLTVFLVAARKPVNKKFLRLALP